MFWRRVTQAACLMTACLHSLGCRTVDYSPVETPMVFDGGQASPTQETVVPVDPAYPLVGEGPIVQASYQLPEDSPPDPGNVMMPPSEGHPYSHPMYRIEPPDILLINAINLVPKDPYIIQPLDQLQLFAGGALPERPIAGIYQVEPNGMVNLGPGYGAIMVAGLSVPDAITVIERHLQREIAVPAVSLTVTLIAGQQLIAGEHLVGLDGTVNLGIHGSVYVVGMTVAEAARAIEIHLSREHESPRVSVDIFSYNSKVYYIVIEGAGLGDNVIRIPITGNETVLDAIAQIGGLTQLSSTDMWIARPGPAGMECHQILPVDWEAITRGADPSTNYQIFPGDRIFIAEDRLRAFDSLVSKVSTPFERIAGSMLLWGQTIQTMQRFPGQQRR